MADKKSAPFSMGANLGQGWGLIDEGTPQTAPKLLKPNAHSLATQSVKRKGKKATLIGEFFIDEAALKSLLKTLKTKLACGGAIEERHIMLQGTQESTARDILHALGYTFKHKG